GGSSRRSDFWSASESIAIDSRRSRNGFSELPLRTCVSPVTRACFTNHSTDEPVANALSSKPTPKTASIAGLKARAYTEELWGYWVKKTPSLSLRLEFVQPIECRHFERFRQRWVVEDGVAKVFDSPSQCEHRLSDVNDLAGAVADDVHAQQLQAVGIEDELQKSLIVPQHLSFGKLRVTSNAGFVPDLVAGELLFGRSYHGNVRDGGLKVLIHDQLAASVGHESNRLQVELVAIGLAPDRV